MFLCEVCQGRGVRPPPLRSYRVACPECGMVGERKRAEAAVATPAKALPLGATAIDDRDLAVAVCKKFIEAGCSLNGDDLLYSYTFPDGTVMRGVDREGLVERAYRCWIESQRGIEVALASLRARALLEAEIDELLK